MDLEQLRKFLLSSIQAGYAAAGELKAKEESDFSKSLHFKQGDFVSHDNWFGGEPYGGRTIVYFKKNPVWMMVYYGSVDPAFTNLEGVYTFLRKALLKVPEDLPLRGPKTLIDGHWLYQNEWSGSLGIFSGDEAIFYDKKPIYSATYAGGFVDNRKD